MRRRLLATALVTTAALAAPGAAAAQSANRCGERGSTTQAQNRFVRVYTHNTLLYGCLKRNGRTRVLHRPSPDENEFEGIGLVAVAHTRVAWVTAQNCTICDSGGPSARVRTKNLTGSETRTLRGIRDETEDSALVGEAVDALAVDTCGRVAFRTVATSIRDTVDPNPQLSVWTAAGRRTVDAGDIDRRSLRIRADRVTWSRGGVEMSAPVEGPCFE